jgi:translation initiation factor IF-2
LNQKVGYIVNEEIKRYTIKYFNEKVVYKMVEEIGDTQLNI